MFPAFTLYLTLAFCSLGIGLAVVRYDLYDREPWPLILGAIGLGALGMMASYYVEVGAIEFIHGRGLPFGYTGLAFLAGVVEEVFKALGVLVIVLAARRHFNDPLDGLIYGSFVGLGAAIEESAALIAGQVHLRSLPATEPVRLVGHLIMGGIGAFGLGLLTMRHSSAHIAAAGSLAAAVALHIAWDLAAFDQLESGPPLTFSQTLIPVLLMLLGMLIYRRLASVGARLTREHRRVRNPRAWGPSA